MNRFAISLLLLLFPLFSLEASMHLVNRLRQAERGDYIVTAMDHTYTVLLVKEKSDAEMVIEEITLPSARIKSFGPSWPGWRGWVEGGAPGFTSWVVYAIDSRTGCMNSYYSFTHGAWCNISSTNNFLSTLLGLNFSRVPKKDLKKVGPPPGQGLYDKRRLWEPRMVYEGQAIAGVSFEAWRTVWPNDGSDLSGRSILVYLPVEDPRYPSYFPYWLEIRGMVGKAKIRIIDSGKNLLSPRLVPAQI